MKIRTNGKQIRSFSIICPVILTACLLASSSSALNTNIALNKGSATGTVYYGNITNAFDGNPATYASAPGLNLCALAADLGSEKNLYKTVVTIFGNVVAQRYKLQGSTNGSTWNDILRVSFPLYPTDERILPNVSYRYVRIIYSTAQPGMGGDNTWRCPDVCEFQIFERGSADPVGIAPIVYPEPLDRTGWSATNNNGGDINLIINKPDKGWTDPHGGLDLDYASDFYAIRPNGGIAGGEYVQIDMKSARTFDQISYTSEHENFHQYEIYVSDDGATWGSPVAIGRDTIGKDAITFARQTKRYVRFVNTWNSTNACNPNKFSGFFTFSVLNTAGSTAVDTGAGPDMALNKTAIVNNANNTSITDGNLGTSADVDVGTIDLGQSQEIGVIKMRHANGCSGTTIFNLLTSDNNTDWVVRQIIQTGSLTDNWTTIIPAGYSARYLRFDFPPYQMWNQDHYPAISAIEVYKPVTFGPQPNQPPSCSITTPANNTAFGPAPATVEITANAFDDHAIKRVEFYNGTALLGQSTSSPYTYSWANVPVGTYTLTVKAYDDSSISKVSDTVHITVTNNAAPAVLSRTGWTATASNSTGSNVAANALDGNANSIWSLGETPGQTANQWFTIDMKSVNTVYSVTLQQSAGNFVKNYSVYVTGDLASPGTAVATGAGTSENLTITLTTPTAGRYIKIVQTGGTCQCWWGLGEINMTGLPGGTVAVRPAAIKPVLLTKMNGAVQLYTITGRRIEANGVKKNGAGLFLCRTINGNVASVKTKVLVR